LSDQFWRGPLHADPAVVGQALTLDDRSCTVLGVMPPGFAFYPPQTQIWSLLLPNDPRLKNFFGVFMIGRLKPGATIAQAQAELTALHTALHADATNGENRFTPLVGGLQDWWSWRSLASM
jgi:putative ABC transport system permease protein